MAITNFLPTVWAAQVNTALKKSLVFAQPGITVGNYSGEVVSYGKAININFIGDINVNPYVSNTTSIDPQELTDTQKVLDIDQRNYFAFYIDDVEIAQMNPKIMAQAMTDAAYKLADKADQYIAGLYTAIPASNQLYSGADTQVGGTGGKSAYDVLVDFGIELDENNVPREGRWVIVPPWFHGQLLKDNNFIGTGSSLGDSTLLNGVVGRAAGLDVLVSNNVEKTGVNFKVMAGYQGAIAYADQIQSIEAYRPQDKFADAVKGLHVFGAEVIRPTALALGSLYKG